MTADKSLSIAHCLIISIKLSERCECFFLFFKSKNPILLVMVPSLFLKFSLDSSLNEFELSHIDLSSGIYLYSLIVDGQLIETKRMVIER